MKIPSEQLPTLEALDLLIRPKSVAVIGASTDEFGMAGAPLINLQQHGYSGDMYAVNPRRDSVFGVRSYPSIADLPGPVDTAVVVTSAPQVPGVLRELARVTRTATIITAGFGVVDRSASRAEMRKIVKSSGLRIIGPNTAGLMNLNDSYVPRAARNHPLDSVAGPVALISQSGGVGNTIFSRAQTYGMPIGLLIGTGDSMDITVWDAARYAVEAGHAETLLIVVEAPLPRHELVSLAEVCAARDVQVVLLKMARTVAGQRAAMTHTGSMASDARVGIAAARNLGFVVVHDLDELWQVGWLHHKWKAYPRGPVSLGMYCMSGGLSVEAADLADEFGVDLPVLAARDDEPPFANPFDPGDRPVPGEVQQNRTSYLVERFGTQPELDCVLFAMPVMSEAMAIRSKPGLLDGLSRIAGQRTALSMYSAGLHTEALRQGLRASGQPLFDSLRTAVKAIALYARPSYRSELAAFDGWAAVGESRPLSYWESRRQLAEAGMSFPDAILADDESSAAAFASADGPVVMKGSTQAISHKVQGGLVRLGVAGADEAIAAYRAIAAAAAGSEGFDGVVCERQSGDGVDLILAATRHPEWGVFLSIGTGGYMAESADDIEIIFPPFTEAAIALALGRTRVGQWAADRGQGTEYVLATAIRLGQELLAHPDDTQYEVNPLRMRTDDGSVEALDALVLTAR
jgi:acetate---CoA ligase (ADP-forming)